MRREYKKIFLAAVCIVLVALFYVLYNNQEYIKSKITDSLNYNLTNHEAGAVGLNVVDGYINTTNEDSQYILTNINKYVSEIYLNIDYLNGEDTLQVFYTDSRNPDFSEQASHLVRVDNGKNIHRIPLDNSLKIESIRIDVSTKKDQRIQINEIILNKDITFHINIIHLLKLEIFTLLIIGLVLIVFKYPDMIVRKRYIIAGMVFIVLVVGKLHGSSIGLWESEINKNLADQSKTTLLGKERTIRSDEFLVHTPWLLSQVNNRFDVINSDIKSMGMNALLLNVPAISLDIVGKPYFWGFVIFGEDFGLSWYWSFKIIMLFLLSFEICMFLTNRSKLLSLFGGLWVALSPSIQWWYDTPAAVSDLILLTEGMIVSLLYFVHFKEKCNLRSIFIILFVICGIGFTTILYPPVQVPLAFLVLIMLGSMMVKDSQAFKLVKKEWYVLILSILYAIAAIAFFIYYALDDIKLLLNTAYPGERLITGGSLPYYELQTYLINWLLPFKEVSYSNQSELASYYNFAPLLILTFIFIIKYEKNNKRIIIALFGYLMFQLSWLFVTYPKIIAKLSLFSYVQEARVAHISFGFLGVFLSVWMINMIYKHKMFNYKHKIVLTSVIFILYSISIFGSPMKDYLGVTLAIGTIIIFTMLNYLLLSGNLKKFIILFLPIIISGVFINPVAQGTDSIKNLQISNQIKKIELEDPNQTWVATESIFNGQLLIALGVKSMNSVHFTPDMNLWSQIDVKSEFEDIYNRYAHVIVNVTDNDTNFELTQLDVIRVNINHSELQELGIKYILSPSIINSDSYEEIYYDNDSGLYIYRVLDNRS
ncbi:DUF7657 domain-containing protein [Paenibacillus arenosi]|uniref:Glycosyltransferase RgtA/B/C/D-like domain-containing protein n=1 Tax=Paenibacillus arenosi TaxID=2774142 RepID=A0ABR9B6B1_9BACL|nr:hypothetical protein [Paenibacillus arenosi]MBD8500990.1 hypothetical protein [Paenibacillus arenosi]